MDVGAANDGESGGNSDPGIKTGFLDRDTACSGNDWPCLNGALLLNAPDFRMQRNGRTDMRGNPIQDRADRKFFSTR